MNETDSTSASENGEAEWTLTGTAKTLRSAMTVTNLSDMIECFKDLKSSSSTIERDLPLYFQHRPMISTVDSLELSKNTTTDRIQLAKESASNRRYILLHELIQQTKIVEQRPHTLGSSKKNLNRADHQSSVLENQVQMMRHVIAAQPSALEGIYLEALLNPDQWQANHHRLQTSTQETLTLKERQRLKELLNQSK